MLEANNIFALIEAASIIAIAVYCVCVGIAYYGFRGPKVGLFIHWCHIVVLVVYLLIHIVGMGVYFWYFQITFYQSEFDLTECIHGWAWLDMCNFAMIFCATASFGFILALGSLGLLCFFPSIMKEIKKARGNKEEQNQVIKSLVHMGFNPSMHTDHERCLICFDDFKETDDVVPLPCNTNHYFHGSCIELWM